MRPFRRLHAAAVLGLAITVFPGFAPTVAARLPTTPTVDFDKANESRDMTLIFYVIPDNGLPRSVWISCDGGTTRSDPYPFADRILVSLDLPGCEGYGLKTVDVQVEDANGPVFWGQVTPGISPRLSIDRPLMAVTGHPFTLAPRLPDDYDLPAGSLCRYEFRWGDDQSLLHNDYDETFGALGFDRAAKDGDCPTWTFTLPWVPFRQYELYLSVGFDDGGGMAWSLFRHVTFTATEDGTRRLIADSNLPLVQVLPDTYTPIVGQPVTYTRYLIGGATAGSSSDWNAWQGRDPDLNHWHQSGGATFTITPWEPGNVNVGWQRGGERLFYGMYDPPVRYRDRWAPVAKAPVARLRTTPVGDTVPASITWDGSDRGWGIAAYQLDRSVDGGAWHRILSRKTKHLDVALATGHAYRYRVRAVDKAGHRGAWAEGPTFHPRAIGDASTSIAYHGSWTVTADAMAAGGALHEATSASASATFRFTGRDVAWVAERGPGHGKAKVYVDGTLAGTIDLAATSDLARRIVFKRHFAARDAHAVRIVVLGTAGRPTVDVDGFLVLR